MYCMEKPLISVIIPVYNPGKYLYRCLDSVTGQTYQNLEIILIDDGSTDQSGAVCDVYAERDARIICIHQENRGVSSARNRGLEIASGDYIHFPDSDDYLELDTYEYLLGLVQEHACDVVNFEHFITYPDGTEHAHSFAAERYGLFDVQGTYWQMVNGVQFCCNKLFRRELLMGKDKGERLTFREDIFRGEDTLLAAMAIARAKSVWFDPRPLYHYVQSEQSACRGKFRASQLSVIKLYQAYEPIYGQYPDVWNDFLLFMQQTLISIYFDMWADDQAWTRERAELAVLLSQKRRLIKRKLSAKLRVKLGLFDCSPTMFCMLHKFMHKL